MDLRLLLDVGAFRVDDRFTTGADRWLSDEAAHDHDHHHLDDEQITTVSFITREPFDVQRLEAFWGELPETCFRGKGVLNIQGYEERCVFHQVGARVLLEAQTPWGTDETRESRLVFIGKVLDSEAICAKLRRCAAIMARK